MTTALEATGLGKRYGSTSTSLVRLSETGVRYAFNAHPRDPSGWYDVPIPPGVAQSRNGPSTTG